MRDHKNVIVIYSDALNKSAMDFIKRNLEEIFNDYITFSESYLENLEEGTLLKADAFLVVGEQIFDKVKKYVKDFNKIIKVNRSPNRKALNQISKIAAGTNVLVVNDTYDNTIDTVNSFYEIGIGHINMVPYDSTLAHTGIYDNISVAITPAEIHLVPGHIKRIIDIGYRQVSFDTMFKLMKLLDLDIGVINRNLFKYMQSLVESNGGLHANYIYGYLKSEMLSHVVNSSTLGMVLVDAHYQTVYANEKALKIFSVTDKSQINLYSNVEIDMFSSNNNESVLINGSMYFCCKYPIPLMDEIIGYYITLQDEIEYTYLNKANKRRGYVTKHSFKDIVHESKDMDTVIKIAKKIALTDYTVLIRGESGTGKELFAQSIHNSSHRNNYPFIAINCAALPDNLLESELFGYEAGAFTGASTKGKIGIFEQAHHGTIFLDEIGDISANLQARLLRTIQEQQLMRIGSDRIIDIDVRVIAATNKDLEKAVRDGEFRSDLYFRLNVLPVIIPPLRKRKADIRPLLRHFLGSDFKNLNTGELKLMENYSWPGNIREVENVCTYYKTLSTLPDDITGGTYGENTAVTSDDRIETAVLKNIKEHTEVSHGVGRTLLIQLLKNDGITLSDCKLRDILSRLNDKKYIEIGKGRAGTRITDAGIKKIYSREEF